MRVIVFGAGIFGRAISEYIQYVGDTVVCFIDNNYKKLGIVNDIKVDSPANCNKYDYDKIIISMSKEARQAKYQLVDQKVDESKITIFIENEKLKEKVLSRFNRYNEENDVRVRWLRAYAKFVYERNIYGEIAECGVNRGEFSHFMNKYFYDRKLYLFDTFCGFSDTDLNIEKGIDNEQFVNGDFNTNKVFKNTSEKIVLNHMVNKNNCILKKGYFPDTARGLNERFCFVNLDMDLYQPMYEGLKFFYNKMEKGGVILLHDYYNPHLPGVKKAVHDFENQIDEDLNIFPIGDGVSIALIK